MATLVHERDGDDDLVLTPERSGTLRQVTGALDAIRDVGCNVVWVMPPWIRGEANRKGAGSPYAVRDYGGVEPTLGNDRDLADLVAQAHARRLKVIAGFVPNHVACDAAVLARHRPPDDPWVYCWRDDPQRAYHDGDWTDTVK